MTERLPIMRILVSIGTVGNSPRIGEV